MSLKAIKILFRYKWRLFIVASLLVLLYNEVLVHHLQAYNWRRPNCEGNCTRILLVADPQLIGETFDEHLYNGVAIYDSDNYLRRTFNRAFHHVRPNLILFLGDIFDEGSVASSEAYQRYVDRFHRIFQSPQQIPMIIVPGDNDIGGEDGEVVTPRNVHRFKDAFKTRPFYKIGNTLIYPVNKMTHEVLKEAPSDLTDSYNNNPSQRTIVISHFPLLFHQSQYADRVLRQLQPTIIFSGHLHRSLFIKRSQVYTEFAKANPLNTHENDKYSMHEFDLTDTIKKESFLEILVPTCSYRMGEKSVGYGMAVLDHQNDNLYYTILWSVERFVLLYEYLVLLSIWAIVGLIWLIIFALRHIHRRNVYNYNKISCK